MHPIRHPRNVVVLGIGFIAGRRDLRARSRPAGLPHRVGRRHHARCARGRDVAHGVRPDRRLVEGLRPARVCMEALWHSILDLLSKVVMPDWGELIRLLPLGLAGLVDPVVRLDDPPVRDGRSHAACAGPAARRSPRRRSTCRARPTPRSSPRRGAAALLWGTGRRRKRAPRRGGRPRPDAPVLGPRGDPRLRPRHARRDAPGGRPRRSAARRPHARAVVPPAPRRARRRPRSWPASSSAAGSSPPGRSSSSRRSSAGSWTRGRSTSRPRRRTGPGTSRTSRRPAGRAASSRAAP